MGTVCMNLDVINVPKIHPIQGMNDGSSFNFYDDLNAKHVFVNLPLVFEDAKPSCRFCIGNQVVLGNFVTFTTLYGSFRLVALFD